MNGATTDLLDRRLAGRLAGRLASRAQAVGPAWVAQVVSWMDLVELCRELDDSLLAVEIPTTEALALHDAVVGLAIGCGGWLLHELRTSGAYISAAGQTLATLEASLELLRILHRSRHAPFPTSEIESAREVIFRVAA